MTERQVECAVARSQAEDAGLVIALEALTCSLQEKIVFIYLFIFILFLLFFY